MGNSMDKQQQQHGVDGGYHPKSSNDHRRQRHGQLRSAFSMDSSNKYTVGADSAEPPGTIRKSTSDLLVVADLTTATKRRIKQQQKQQQHLDNRHPVPLLPGNNYSSNSSTERPVRRRPSAYVGSNFASATAPQSNNSQRPLKVTRRSKSVGNEGREKDKNWNKKSGGGSSTGSNGDGPLTPAERSLISSCWENSKHGDLGNRIYVRVFEKRKDLTTSGAYEGQGKEIWQAEGRNFTVFLAEVVTKLENVDELDRICQNFGAHHVDLRYVGFKPDFWVTMADAMATECLYLDQGMHPPADVIRSWGALISFMFSNMRDGYYYRLRTERRMSKRLSRTSTHSTASDLPPPAGPTSSTSLVSSTGGTPSPTTRTTNNTTAPSKQGGGSGRIPNSVSENSAFLTTPAVVGGGGTRRVSYTPNPPPRTTTGSLNVNSSPKYTTHSQRQPSTTTTTATTPTTDVNNHKSAVRRGGPNDDIKPAKNKTPAVAVPYALAGFRSENTSSSKATMGNKGGPTTIIVNGASVRVPPQNGDRLIEPPATTVVNAHITKTIIVGK